MMDDYTSKVTIEDENYIFENSVKLQESRLQAD